MSKQRQYDYQCLSCSEYFDLIRSEDDRYAEVSCPHCEAISDGKLAKRILSAASVHFTQGKLKGRMNSRGR
jgi:putative FmdB family regulatory protein